MYVTGRMACGKDQIICPEGFVPVCGHFPELSVTDGDTRNTFAEKHLSTGFPDGISNSSDYSGQSVRSQVRMCLIQYCRISSVQYQQFQHAPVVAPLFGSCIELAVGKGACATLTETVI